MSGRSVSYSEISAKEGHGLTHTVGYEYDDINNLTQLVEDIDGTEKITSYTYDEDNRTTSITTDGITVEYTYDGFGRVTQQVTKLKGETAEQDQVILTEYFTFTEPSDTATSGQVATYRTVSAGVDVTYSYTYDKNGNILTVSDGTYLTTYTYDSANQLIREDNQRKNASYTWTYDNAGNILTFNTYAYTTGSLGSQQDSVPYVYGDEGWGDLLTSLDGNAISYDTIGNPLSDGTRSYTWQHGRQLAQMTKGNATWTYTYNNAGLRTSRTNGTTTYKYVYSGSQLVQMTILTGADLETATKEVIDFTYDASGNPLTLKYGGATYYYMVNLQGDVTGIMDSNGNRILDYGYTAYGQAVVRATTVGNTADTLARINPLLYRGYVFDMGTGLYYLQSRYYDPAVGRFINADDPGYLGSGGLTSFNLFAYCGNNPVSYVDPCGTCKHSGKAFELCEECSDKFAEYAEEFLDTWIQNYFTSFSGGIVGRELHYARNLVNETYTEEEWIEKGISAVGENEDKYHQNNQIEGRNRKYVESGWFSSENVYYSDGSLNDTPEDEGTVNVYYGDDWFGKYVIHGLYDVFPYIIYGNSPDDSTTIIERILEGFE